MSVPGAVCIYAERSRQDNGAPWLAANSRVSTLL